jgi:16S rRNA (guanine1207-N2)-methyltransferase
MPDHYFTKSPESAHRPGECQFMYRGHGLTFETDAGVFSRDGIDKGTELLLCALPDLSGDVLDMGCGWGAVGISAARAYPGVRVTMTDINSRAVELSRKNVKRNGVSARVMESDGFSALYGEKFSFILTNPPIRAGKQVIYDLFAKSAEHLLPGGSLYLVIRKQQGAPSALTYLNTIFAKTQVAMRSGGFWVIRADI